MYKHLYKRRKERFGVIQVCFTSYKVLMKGCLPVFCGFFFGGIIAALIVGFVSHLSWLLAVLLIFAIFSGIFAAICIAIDDNGTKLSAIEKRIKLVTKKGIGKTRRRGWRRRNVRAQRR